MIDWNTVFALIGAATGLLSAGAACWSAASATRSNRQAACERRSVLEREASRGIAMVPAAASRVVALADRLERDSTTMFALAGRNVAAAAPHKERAIERRREAEGIAALVNRWLNVSLESCTDGELERLVRETDGSIVQLEKLELSLDSELRSLEEQIRPLRERALVAHQSSSLPQR